MELTPPYTLPDDSRVHRHRKAPLVHDHLEKPDHNHTLWSGSRGGVAVSGTTEVDLFDVSPGVIIPADIANGHLLRGRAFGRLFNNSGATQNYTFNLKIGGTTYLTITTGIATSTATRRLSLEFHLGINDGDHLFWGRTALGSAASSEASLATEALETQGANVIPLSLAAIIGLGITGTIAWGLSDPTMTITPMGGYVEHLHD